MHGKTRFPAVWSAVGSLLLFMMGCGSQDDGGSRGRPPVFSPPPGEGPSPSPGSTCGTSCQLVFLTEPQTVAAEQCSREVVVQVRSAQNAPLVLDRPLQLSLWSRALASPFYADAACTESISHIAIASGESTARYYYKPVAAGRFMHEVSASQDLLVRQFHTVTSATGPLRSTCRLQFPPAAGVPCDIDTPGEQYYVSATRGDDSAPGSLERPWATLTHAVRTAPPGSTVRVAAGTYSKEPEPYVGIWSPLTVKGGFNDTFSEWDPDRFHSLYGGRVWLEHDGATFGGFRLVARPSHGEQDLPFIEAFHRVYAGTFIRNYVELLYSEQLSGRFMAVGAGASRDATSRVLCNDIYVRGASLMGQVAISALTFQDHSGTAEVSSNRICADHSPTPWDTQAVEGSGSCSLAGRARVTLTNNLIEARQRSERNDEGWGMTFSGCASDMDVVLTNNTIISTHSALSGSPAQSGATVHWKLRNNIFFGDDSTGAALAFDGPLSLESGGNLVFGYTNNRLSPEPAPTSTDDTTGEARAETVFQDSSRGDFRPRPGGAAAGRGLNLHGDAASGAVTRDLLQRPRPVEGAWDRGALLAPATGN
ncbi:DUF1565 domain-containing protein [Pyxidicoccus fallax]|uniref:DUF1565 domain-containing protein n=1 Tax=Pyxidicoccus fallax TaxID=394095 RepID=A0A848LDE5_9BACT|nr:DUF1565 domain-containing protein [Pyxidicoccus fallax]NMO13448.1 DUF1565 domain-containing protein [Pyxidicoccus fallax]NPC81142.1 DUF1565 domain-containing protein [Pyxidicoccus fallax]